MGAANGDYPLPKMADAVPVSVDCSTTWECLNAEFRSILAPIASGLSADELSPVEAGDLFSTLLRAHAPRIPKPYPGAKQDCTEKNQAN